MSLTILTVLFISCTKDDEVNGDSLNKSTFNYSGYEITNGVTDDFSDKGTYTYDYPNVLTSKNKTKTSTISGNKLIFGTGKNEMIYTRK